MKGLKGKRVFISGGGGDIGRAVAAEFISEGSVVVIADLMDLTEGRALAEKLSSTHACYVHCDVTSRKSVDEAIANAIDHMGGIDVAISNAGCVTNQPFLEIGENEWRKTLEVNLTGSFFFAQAAAKAMLKNPRMNDHSRGVLLFTGSWVQSMPWPEGASYCASKGGQEMLMKVIAQELAAYRITCNIIAPGMVYAGLTKVIYDRDEQFRKRANAAIPLDRMSSAEELAGSYTFLASDAGSYITGASILIDGGATLVRRS